MYRLCMGLIIAQSLQRSPDEEGTESAELATADRRLTVEADHPDEEGTERRHAHGSAPVMHRLSQIIPDEEGTERN